MSDPRCPHGKLHQCDRGCLKNMIHPLKAIGVGRTMDNRNALVVYFDREPSDRELSSFHDLVTKEPQ